jgi:hypothetical protein
MTTVEKKIVAPLPVKAIAVAPIPVKIATTLVSPVVEAKVASKATTKPVTKKSALIVKKPVKTPVKAATKNPIKTPAKPLAKTLVKPKNEKLAKLKKPKLVRDSFTIPKAEYTVLDDLKQRATKLAHPAKKSELIRAGVKALAAMSDIAFMTALKAVPAIKTGRPAKN